VRIDRASILVTGQDEVYFVLRVSLSQPDAAEVGFGPPAVGVVRITLTEVRTRVALVTVVSAVPTHQIWRGLSDDGVQWSALSATGVGVGWTTLSLGA
jgi:hypothetical protein